MGRIISLSALLAAVVLVAYWPALGGDFVWDDGWLILKNKVVHAPDGIWRMWFTMDPNYYWPVTNTVFWIEWRVFGTNPVGYHVVNLVLHISAALLIWLLLYRLEIPGGYLAALLWAIHPVSVEGVAWISQLKTVLSTVFLLLSMLAYLKADSLLTPGEPGRNRFGGGRWYWLSLLAFLLGMLSKASIAPLPFMLLLVVWWRHGTITRWDLLRVAPFVAVAAALVPINMWFETKGSGEVFRSAGFLERLLGATTVPWFYLGKALLPVNLMFIYPMWSIDTGNVVWWLPLLASIGVTAALVWKRTTWWGRPLLFAWAFFWLGLIPVLGFTDVSLMKFTLVSDHYQYVSLIAVMAVVAAVWTTWYDRMPKQARWSGPVVAAAVVGALAALTWQESATYLNASTLLGATVERNPGCWVAHCGLGINADDAHQLQDALTHFEHALQYNPDYPEAHDRCGLVLLDLGRVEEAIPHFEQAVRLAPKFAPSRNNLGAALLRVRRVPEAVTQFEKAVELAPNVASTRANLALAFYRSDQPEKALAEFRTVIRLDPNRAEPYCDLGAALINVGKPEEALEPLQQSLRLNPDLAIAQMNLGNALLQLERGQEAIECYKRFLAGQPNDTNAWANLAKAHLISQHADEAVHAAQKAAVLARAEGRGELADSLDAWLNSNNDDGTAGASALPASALPPGPQLPPELMPPGPALPPGS